MRVLVCDICVLCAPGLAELTVAGVAWPAVAALCQGVRSCLRMLDLSGVDDLKDAHLRELLAPPPDSRTGEHTTRKPYMLLGPMSCLG